MASNQQSITSALWSYFKGKGFTPAQEVTAISGVEGNLKIESGFNPNAYNAREGARGLAQWENGRGESGALGAYARKVGGKTTDLAVQEGFLESELNGPYASTVTGLRSAANASAAADVFASRFEGNDPSSDGARESAASNIFGSLRSQVTTLAAGKPVTFPGTGSSSSSSSGGASATETSALTDLAGGAAGALVKPVGNIVIKSVVVLGGLALVVVGLFRASGTQTDPAAVAALAAAA